MLIHHRTCKIQEDKTKTMEELLRRRELAVKMTEDTYDQKLKNELSRCYDGILLNVSYLDCSVLF